MRGGVGTVSFCERSGCRYPAPLIMLVPCVAVCHVVRSAASAQHHWRDG